MRLCIQKFQRSNLEHRSTCKTEGKTPPQLTLLTQRPFGHSAPRCVHPTGSLIHSPAVTPGCPCHSAVQLTPTDNNPCPGKKAPPSARGALVTSPSWPGFEELFPGEKQHRPRRSCTSIPTIQWISHGIATTNSRVLRLFGS